MLFRQFIRRVRAHPRLLAGLVAGVAFVTAVVWLASQAAEDAGVRRSPEAQRFEADPSAWLAHEVTVSEFVRTLQAGELAEVGLAASPSGLVLYTTKNGTQSSTTVPGCAAQSCAGTVLEELPELSVKTGFVVVSINVDPRPGSRRTLDGLLALLSPVLMFAMIAGALVLVTRLQSGAGNTATNLSETPKTRFSDVIGNAEAKAALQRVKAFMHEPARYQRVGAVPPRGVLLVGPPGTGKTLLAKALAGESKANFIAVDGSYFSAMYFGAGIGRVKSLFKLARQKAPCVLFIDEIDGLGKRSHGGQNNGGESELNRIINRILVEMDGFEPLDNVVVVGATNHEDNIDEAMRRPGRFDMVVRLALPTLPERQSLFDLYIGRVAHDGSADAASLARMSAGLSPADIANLVNKAASTAAEGGAQRVGAEHFHRALETQRLGGEVSALKGLLSEETRLRLAYHEAGHALVGHCLGVGLVERVTIEPRGQALGVTYIAQAHEEPLYQAGELANRLAMMLAGREAEMLVCGNVSTGASDDLKRASELATNMVGSLGFSEAFGLLSVAGVPKELIGPDVQAAVLREARSALEHAQTVCRQVFKERRAQLDALAHALLASEVVSGAELAGLLNAAPALPAPCEA